MSIINTGRAGLNPDKPVEVVVPHGNGVPREKPASPLHPDTKCAIHDRMLEDLEVHSPEGANWYMSPWIRIGLPIGATIIIVGGLTTLAVVAGPPALLLGIMIVIAMYGLAAYPQWNSARLRLHEHEKFEKKIDRTIKRVEKRVETGKVEMPEPGTSTATV